MTDLLAAATRLQPDTVALRRALHRRPEVGLAFLGACPPGLDPEHAPANHSDRVLFDEDAMAVGVATHTAVALAALAG